MAEPRSSRFDPVNAAFLVGTPVLAAVGAWWSWHTFGFAWSDLALCLVLYVATGISITAGYHRYYSHRTYRCHPVVQLFWLLFGGAAVQNSVLFWASDHRDHHRYVDSEQDPYDIMKGIFWAHMGWIFYKDLRPRTFANAPDLQADPLVRWQHRWYLPLTILVGAGLPLAIGFAEGRVWPAFIWGGLVRVVLCHHGTFLINSASHWLGTQPYSRKDTSRDNPWLAFLTFGEGYHNFHHSFEGDYRNGLRWYHWDPSKWLIRALATVGLAGRLNRVPEATIQRARMARDLEEARAALRAHPAEWRERMLARLEAGRRRVDAALDRVARLRRRLAEGPAAPHPERARLARVMALKLRRARRAVALARERYRAALRDLARSPLPTA